MKKRSLWFYVVGVIIAFIIVNLIVGFYNASKLQTSIAFSLGFFWGMIGMYLAVHMYRWK